MSHELTIAGACTFWNVAASSNREFLREGLQDIGHEDLCPGQRTAFAAAKRAASVLYPGAAYHIGTLKDHHGVTIERVVHSESTRNEYPQIAFMVLDEESEGLRNCVVVDPVMTPAAQISAAESLEVEYEKQMKLCSATAVGIALTKTCEKLGGTRLRRNGGVYFIPEFSVSQFQQIAKVFEGAAIDGGTYVERLTVAKSDETLRGVHNSLRTNTLERVAEIREELANEIGKRCRVNRTEEVQRLLDKTTAYEQLLNESLADVKDDLELLGQELVRNTLAASAEMMMPVEG